jgi:hypothetical protein
MLDAVGEKNLLQLYNGEGNVAQPIQLSVSTITTYASTLDLKPSVMK